VSITAHENTLPFARRFEWCLELFQTSIGVPGLGADFAEGAGTHRDSAEKESWN
jgi:hypothetical protein